ncbi:MAG: hypothetical protein ACRCVW_03100 [Brevinema sp.]
MIIIRMMIFLLPMSIFGGHQHQVFVSLGGGQSREVLDTRDNLYHVGSFVSGVGYRYQYIFDTRVDQFLSINFGLGGRSDLPLICIQSKHH